MSFNFARQSFVLTFIVSSILLSLFFWSESIMSTGGMYGYSVINSRSEALMQTPISKYIYSFFLNTPQLVRLLTIGILALINGVVIARIVTRNMLVPERTYMPITICIIISCGLSVCDSVIIPLLASSFFIYAFDTIMRSFRRIVEYSLIFNGTLCIGLAIIIYPPMAITLPLLPIAMVILRKNGREWIIALAGVSLPLLLCSYIYWGLGQDFSYFIMSIIEVLSQISLRTDYTSLLKQPQLIVLWSTVAVIVTLSIVKFIQNGSRTRTRPYKTFLIAIWSLPFPLILTLVFRVGASAAPLLALPLSILIPYYFNRTQGWLSNLLYSLLFVSIITSNVTHLL